MQALADNLRKGKEGLKKYRRRAKENFLQKLGAHSGTNDPAFDEKVASVELLDHQLQTMYDAVSDYLEATSAMQQASVKMGKAFSEIIAEGADLPGGVGAGMASGLTSGIASGAIDEEEEEKDSSASPDIRLLVQEYLDLNLKIRQFTKESIEITCMETVVRPAGEKLKAIPVLTQKVSQRQQKLLDFDAYRAKLNAESTKNPNSETTLKLASKLERARESVDCVTHEVLEACDEIGENHAELIASGFSSLVACQTMLSIKSAESLEPLLKMLPRSAEALCMISTHEFQE